MDILNHAILVEGGISRLARALGLEPNVVSNWLYRKTLPKSWEMALSLKYSKRKAKESV